MAAMKRGRHAKQGGRTTPKGTHPLQLVRSDRRPREPGMMEMVAGALRQPHPVDLVGFVSSMVWLASPTTPSRPARPAHRRPPRRHVGRRRAPGDHCAAARRRRPQERVGALGRGAAHTEVGREVFHEQAVRALPGAGRGYEGVGLGSTDLLTSTGRASILARRDRGLQLLAR